MIIPTYTAVPFTRVYLALMADDLQACPPPGRTYRMHNDAITSVVKTLRSRDRNEPFCIPSYNPLTPTYALADLM